MLVIPSPATPLSSKIASFGAAGRIGQLDHKPLQACRVAGHIGDREGGVVGARRDKRRESLRRDRRRAADRSGVTGDPGTARISAIELPDRAGVEALLHQPRPTRHRTEIHDKQQRQARRDGVDGDATRSGRIADRARAPSLARGERVHAVRERGAGNDQRDAGVIRLRGSDERIQFEQLGDEVRQADDLEDRVADVCDTVGAREPAVVAGSE